jgi:hypothetical protein
VAWIKKPNLHPIVIGTEFFVQDTKNLKIKHKRHSKSAQSWNLVIEDAQPSDSGVYECQVTSVVPLTFDIHLHVLGMTRFYFTLKREIKFHTEICFLDVFILR